MSWCSIWLLDSFLFFHRSVRTGKRTSTWISVMLVGIVHVTGRIHKKVRFSYNYYFLLYWGNHQGQGSDDFLIGLSARLTPIGILKGDIEFVIQDIQTFCPNRSNPTEKSISGRLNALCNLLSYTKSEYAEKIWTLVHMVQIVHFRPDRPIFTWYNTELIRS